MIANFSLRMHWYFGITLALASGLFVPGMNGCFHRKRTFKLRQNHQYDRLLSARTGHSAPQETDPAEAGPVAT
jgi:hypothetical protein